MVNRKTENKKSSSSSSVAAALKPELKIINSPLSPAPKQEKPKRSVIAKPESLEEKAKRLEAKAEEKQIVVVLTSTVHYKINWILIRRKFISAGNIFRRKKNKPIPSGVNPKPKSKSLWLRYCAFWNSKFNKPRDENEILYEEIKPDIKAESYKDLIFRSEK